MLQLSAPFSMACGVRCICSSAASAVSASAPRCDDVRGSAASQHRHLLALWRPLSLRSQDIANDGLYHPSANMSIAARVVVTYAPSDYPTETQRSNGFVCGCTNYYNNPCRAEFRKVDTLN